MCCLRPIHASQTCKLMSTRNGKRLGISKHVRASFIDGITVDAEIALQGKGFGDLNQLS